MCAVQDARADESLDLSKELTTLVRQQYDALLKTPYLKMSLPETDAYDRRRLRIEELSKRLAK
jgi:hypothetical protein